MFLVQSSGVPHGCLSIVIYCFEIYRVLCATKTNPSLEGLCHCLRVFTPVIKGYLGKKSFIPVYHSQVTSIRKGVRVGTWRLILKRRPERSACFTSSLPVDCLVWFLIYYKVTCPGIALPSMGWMLPHQLIRK